MNGPTFSDLLLLKHTVNSCVFFKRHYILQSRATQRAQIEKWVGVLISPATYDRAIRRCKDRGFIRKLQRTTRIPEGGHKWNSSVTSITWAVVLWMYRLGELSKEKLEALRRVFGLAKRRGPAKLHATTSPQVLTIEKRGDRSSLFPT